MDISTKVKGGDMPTISHFYGITIVMYLRGKDHNPPHIHAVTQAYAVPFSIKTGEPLAGGASPKMKALVKEFILRYQKELEEMWETGEYRRLPPID